VLSVPRWVSKRADRFQQDPRVVGRAATGAGNRSTPVLISTDPGELLSEVVAQALQDAGLRVGPRDQADLVLEGTVQRLWVAEFATGKSFEYARAYLWYEVVLRNAAGLVVWASSPEGFAISGLTAGDATDLVAPTLERAIEEGVEKLVADEGFWGAVGEAAASQP
jgi:hypothetical protein